MTPTELIEQIEQGFSEGSLAVWCGAGASVSSGLPGAEALTEKILAATYLTSKECKMVRESLFGIPGEEPGRLPFERFMEVVLDSMDESLQTKLLSLFELGQPNLYHRFLAKLAWSGKLKTIYTTNFDTQIEDALVKENFKRGKDFEVLHDSADFIKIDWGQDVVRVIKLHGSVELLTRLAVTVRQVAAPGSVQQVIEPVRSLFCSGRHTGVLFLGYSFSDRFDLSPAITQEGDKSGKFVIDLEYTIQGDKKFKLIDFDDEHPLASYKSKWCLAGDPLEVIKELCSNFEFDDILYEEPIEPDDAINKKTGPSTDWRTFLYEFFNKLDKEYSGVAGNYIAGSLMGMINDNKRALKYFKRSESIAKKIDNVRFRLVSLQSLAGAQISLGQNDEALKTLKQAELLAAKFEDGKFSDNVLTQFGSLYRQIGYSNIERALQYCNKALEVAQKDDDKMRCVPHLSGIAECWMRLGDLDAVQLAYSHILDIVKPSGDLYRKAGIYGNVGSLAYIIRDYKSSLEWYEEACNISALAGDIERVGIHTIKK